MTEQPDTAALIKAANDEAFPGRTWSSRTIRVLAAALDAARAERDLWRDRYDTRSHDAAVARAEAAETERDHEARVSANRLAAHDDTYARLEAAVTRAEAAEAEAAIYKAGAEGELARSLRYEARIAELLKRAVTAEKRVAAGIAAYPANGNMYRALTEETE